MTDEEIRKVAVLVYNATPCQPGAYWEDDRDDAIEAVYRAGMAAERAQCIAEAQGELYDTPTGIRTVAYLRAYNDGVWSVIERLKEKK